MSISSWEAMFQGLIYLQIIGLGQLESKLAGNTDEQTELGFCLGFPLVLQAANAELLQKVSIRAGPQNQNPSEQFISTPDSSELYIHLTTLILSHNRSH